MKDWPMIYKTKLAGCEVLVKARDQTKIWAQKGVHSPWLIYKLLSLIFSPYSSMQQTVPQPCQESLAISLCLLLGLLCN
jgi:hypothetical protein